MSGAMAIIAVLGGEPFCSTMVIAVCRMGKNIA